MYVKATLYYLDSCKSYLPQKSDFRHKSKTVAKDITYLSHKTCWNQIRMDLEVWPSVG